MGELQLLARILTAPFRLAYRLFQTAVVLSVLVIFFMVAPFISFLTMPGYQHDANDKLTADISREYMVMDFSTNTATGISFDGSGTYKTEVPTEYNYKSMNAESHGTLPPQWGFFNLIGFDTDWSYWARGKGAPMYAAYAEAAT